MELEKEVICGKVQEKFHISSQEAAQEVESLEEWCSWQTATCQGHTGWIGWVFPGGVPAN